jgi:hypothetical protein
VALAESGAMALLGTIPIAASDAFAVSGLDPDSALFPLPIGPAFNIVVGLIEVAAIGNAIAASESDAVEITEAATSALASTLAESLAVALTESSASSLSSSAADALVVALTESQNSALATSVADALGVLIAELASIVVTTIVASSESLTVGLLESGAFQDITGGGPTAIAAADSLAIELDEATTSVVAAAPIEALAGVVAEDQASALAATGADVLAVGETESGAVVVATIVSASDGLALTVDDSATPTIEDLPLTGPPAVVPFIPQPAIPAMTWLSDELAGRATQPVLSRRPLVRPDSQDRVAPVIGVTYREVVAADAVAVGTIANPGLSRIDYQTQAILAHDAWNVALRALIDRAVPFDDYRDVLEPEDRELVEVLL